jgi:penicillin-binding protein 1A
LAGIPKKPEGGNPINGPEWALERRNLVLRRMFEQGTVEEEAYNTAVNAPITAKVHQRQIELPSLYIAEMVRQYLLTQYGRGAYNRGLIAHTTIDSHHQLAAEAALTEQLIAYDRRHGYRGPEFHRLQGTDEYLAAPEFGYPTNWLETLGNATINGNQHPAIVTKISDTSIDVIAANLETISIPWDGLKWARRYINVDTRAYPGPATPIDIVAIGDLIRIEKVGDQWQLGQIPDIQGALVALSPQNGAILALAGGFDFQTLQFNHATQAKRQPGSNFKPFFYAGALENGLTAATIYRCPFCAAWR